MFDCFIILHHFLSTRTALSSMSKCSAGGSPTREGVTLTKSQKEERVHEWYEIDECMMLCIRKSEFRFLDITRLSTAGTVLLYGGDSALSAYLLSSDHCREIWYRRGKTPKGQTLWAFYNVFQWSGPPDWSEFQTELKYIVKCPQWNLFDARRWT